LKQVIQSIATNNLSRQDGFGHLCRGNLKLLRDEWSSQHPGSSKRHNPYVVLAQSAVIVFGKTPNVRRYAILSYTFDRIVTTTYDLKYGEAMALLRVAEQFPEEFDSYIEEAHERI